MLERELIEIGLNEKEAKVYLSALELGQSAVQQIALKAGVNRATAYFVIDGLMQRGLMSSFHKGKKQYFIAADPEQLVEILEKEKEELEKKKDNLKKLLPQLKSLNNKQQGRPVVKYYEGKEGIKTMLDEFLKSASSGTSYMAYSVDAINKFFQDKEVASWRSTRAKKGIKTRSIYTYKEGVRESTPDSQRRKVPFDKFPIACDIAVYDDKVRIASLGDRLNGVIIEDKEIAASLKALLDLAWEGAEKYEK
ncbi:MAG TPA: helix-turn-helix domain-containing protein [Patescibacteria group bacterium]